MNGCVYRTEDSKCEFYSDYGKGIVSYCDFDDCEEKKPSNADRIRETVTDEELAQEIWSCHVFASFADLLDWLKEEIDDE